MGTLIQRVTRWLRDFGETWLLRLLQWISVQLGRFTPRVQTRIVRAVQVAVEVHVKSLLDDVSTQAAALTYATFLSLLPLLLVGFSLAGTVISEHRPDDLVPGSDRRHPGSFGDGPGIAPAAAPRPAPTSGSSG